MMATQQPSGQIPIMSDIANRKRIKTREKVISFIQKNDDIIAKYGSIEALKLQFNLCRATLCDASRHAYNDYKSYNRRQKFIENNFNLYSFRTTTVTNESNINETDLGFVTHDEDMRISDVNEEDDDNGNNGANDNNHDIEGSNINNQSNSIDDRGRQNEAISFEESSNLKCKNCHRKQCINLHNRYGNVYQMELYRYVYSFVDLFVRNTCIHSFSFVYCLQLQFI